MSEDKIKCEICGAEMRQITYRHLKQHDITLQEYKDKFPNSPLKSPAAIEAKKKSAVKANAHRKGIARSQEVIDKIKKSKKENPREAWNKGVARTEEEKKIQSETMKRKYKNGEIIHWNTGKTYSLEVKRKISQTLLEKKYGFSEESKKKRDITIENKKKQGWIHPSTLRKGKPANISEETREKLRQATIKNNLRRKEDKIKRIEEHLHNYNIDILHVDDNNYQFLLLCKTCDSTFIRTSSVLNPCFYEKYQGKYCPTCNPPKTGRYSQEYFDNYPDKMHDAAIFYLIEMSSEEEYFLKVGITTRDFDERWKGEGNYEIEPLLRLNMSLYEAFLLESYILDIFSQRYKPKHHFGGVTECLPGMLLESIFDTIIELEDED